MRSLSIAFALATALLAGCGVAYISPSVRPGPVAGANVDVVPLTLQTVAQANSVAYEPRSLPAAFFANAGTGGGLRGAGALPDPTAPDQGRPTTASLRLPPDPGARPYRIGPGDVLRLTTEDASQLFTVQDDGTISVPGVGQVDVGDRVLADAQASLLQRLAAAQAEPDAALEVAEFNARKITIGGAVRQPSVQTLGPAPLFLDQALAAAGGIDPAAQDLAAIRIFRDGQLYQVPAADLYGPRAAPQIRLLDRDSIFVDTTFDFEQAETYFAQQIRLTEARQEARAQALRALELEVGLRRAALAEARSTFDQRLALGSVDRDHVYLTGEVKRQARIPLPFGATASLADALYGEGGFATETGNPGQIYVLRGSSSGDRITAWQLDARNAAALVLATRMELRPNDIIFVAEQPVTRWNRVVQQIVPSLINTTVNAAQQ